MKCLRLLLSCLFVVGLGLAVSPQVYADKNGCAEGELSSRFCAEMRLRGAKANILFGN